MTLPLEVGDQQPALRLTNLVLDSASSSALCRGSAAPDADAWGTSPSMTEEELAGFVSSSKRQLPLFAISDCGKKNNTQETNFRHFLSQSSTPQTTLET
jgi:hypothetical protein